MKRSNLFLLIGVIAAAVVIFLNFDSSNIKTSQLSVAGGELKIYNWSDYIAEIGRAHV